MKKRYALLGFIISILFGVGLPVTGYLFYEKAKEIELVNLALIETELTHLPLPMYYDYYPRYGMYGRYGRYGRYPYYDETEEEYDEQEISDIEDLVGKLSDESYRLQDLLSDLESLCEKEDKRQKERHYEVKAKLRVISGSYNNYMDPYYDGDPSYIEEELEEMVRANKIAEAILSYLQSLHEPGLIAEINRIIDHCLHKPYRPPCSSEK